MSMLKHAEIGVRRSYRLSMIQGLKEPSQIATGGAVLTVEVISRNCLIFSDESTSFVLDMLSAKGGSE